ncbi:MAG: hypothetical protein IKP38_10915 [Clostridia bacterium]|nr:hypothetical protein [Clostridia bacterium]
MELIRNRKLIDRKFREFFFPTVLNMMSASLSFIVDEIIVSSLLGTTCLAAVHACVPISQLISTFGALFGLGAASCISVALGRRETERANRLYTAMLMLVIGTGVLFAVLQAIFMNSIARVLISDASATEYVTAYYRNLVWGTPIMLFLTALCHLMRAEGCVKITSIAVISANLLNLVFDVIFIHFFNMGIGGASLATVLANIIGLGLSMFYLLTKRRTVKFRLKGAVREIPMILKTGVSTALGVGLVAIKIMFINNLVSRLQGATGVAAFSVCTNCLMFMSMFISGSAQTMVPILGVYYGERDFTGARIAVRRARIVLAICVAVGLILLEAASNLIASLFGMHDEAVRALVIRAVRIFAFSLAGTALNFLLLYFYMAVEKRWLSTVISVVNGLAAIVPCALLLSMIWGIDGVWTAFSAAELFTLLAVLILEKGRLFRIENVRRKQEPSKELPKELLQLSADRSTVSQAVEQIHKSLLGGGADEKKAMFVAIAAEEIMVNSIEHSAGKTVRFDVIVRASGNDLLLSVTDDGSPFDPLVYHCEQPEPYATDHIGMIRSVAASVDYKRLIGLNKTYIRL